MSWAVKSDLVLRAEDDIDARSGLFANARFAIAHAMFASS